MRNKARKPQKSPPTPALSPISVTETMFHAGGYVLFQDVYRRIKTTEDQIQRIMARLDASDAARDLLKIEIAKDKAENAARQDASDAERHLLKREIAQSSTERHLLETKIAQDKAESTARQDVSDADSHLLKREIAQSTC